MIAYIKEWAAHLIRSLCEERPATEIFERVHVLAEELNRLDPRDFVVEAQFQFLEARLAIRRWARENPQEWQWWSQHLSQLRLEERALASVEEPPPELLARYPEPSPEPSPER